MPGCAALAAAIVALAGCGGSTPSPAAAVRIRERDFRIAAPRIARAGEVTFSVHNEGPDTYEVIIVRSRDPRLPLRRDAMTVDEDAVKRETAGAVEDVDPGTTGTATVRLRPGRYVLFCNMAGHYRGGMHTELVVKPA